MRFIGQPSAAGVWRVTLALVSSGILLVSTFAQDTPPTGRDASHPSDLSAIQHFVLIVKENRSFDTYFGTFPGAEGATSGTISTGQVIPLSHGPDAMPRSTGYQWLDGFIAIDHGRMDRFDQTKDANINNDYLSYSQLTQADIPNYWAYASHFALADHMFVSLHGPSFPNHLYAIAAQSGGAVGNFINGDKWGCDASATATVEVIDNQGNVTNQYPCFEFPILGDSLDNVGINWTYYSLPGSNWNALDAIAHIRNTSLWTQRVVDQSQFVSDAQAGELPAVSWLVPPSLYSEHPPNSSCQGENWTVKQINAVMQGPDWATTAIFVVWDDWGGFYDHVPPPPDLDQLGFGPRVPMLIISPFTKAGYISRAPYEFSSFLKIVENRFGLSSLTNRDAAANDMLDTFDFNQTPLPPLVLSARTCSPASNTVLAFPPQTVGTISPAKTVYLQNFSETSSMTVSSIVLKGGDFSQTNSCPSNLKAKKSCTVTITFSPATTGVRTGTLTITDSDVTSPQVVNLTGTGTSVTLSPTLLNFGTRTLGGPAKVLTATLKNQGSNGLTISGMVASGDYTQTNTCGGSLPAGGSCVISATFNPKATGTRYGSVTITDSDGASPHVLNLTGVGTGITLSASKLTFASQAVGTTSTPQTLNLTNKGSEPLTISGISILGSINQPAYDYVQINTCGTTVNPGVTCHFSISFSPTGTGSKPGSILVFDSEEGTSPQSVSLAGTGIANSVPLINQPLVPACIAPGGATFTLTVNGTGFLSSAVVQWNGNSLATTFFTSKKLQATVPAANIVSPGTAAVTVVNPSPGGGTSNLAYLAIMNRITSVSFTGPQLATGSHPSAVAMGDFNADRRLDLAITNQNDDTVAILSGKGDGTFTYAPTPSTGRGPSAVVAGDFNSDGKPDLAVANSVDNTISILLGNGDGTFAATADSPPTGTAPLAIAAADFNKDGRLDLAVVNNLENTVSVLLGKGDGTFHTISSPVVGNGPMSVAVGDFNGDGNADLAIANRTDNTVSVLLGKGDGTFTPGVIVGTGLAPVMLVVSDLNADSKLDLVSANQADNSVSVLLGNGDGTFQSHADYGVGSSPSSLSATDFNGDGIMDLVVANAGSNTVSLLLGSGSARFQLHLDFATGLAPGALVIGDFDGDGKPDLAVLNTASNTVSILKQGP
ncbi:MAG: FG-GAP-like repeat-containing protein [Acidobacteriia bacterium]|nr:FG-GAP-like repeat-containing protein [Terriglobia bacterium]